MILELENKNVLIIVGSKGIGKLIYFENERF